MSEQAKTVGEAICGAFLGIPESVDDIDPDKVVRELRDQGILDYHLIPGADAVVTEEDLLAVGYAYEFAHKAALDTNDYEAGLVAGARAALKAAGTTVCDEVVEFGDSAYRMWPTKEDTSDGHQRVVELDEGDRIYIKRADTSTASTRKADVSKSGAEIDKGE